LQNNLGGALLRLAQRESGTTRLQEAIAAYRAALNEYARDRAPLRWAITQHNLGNALTILGERESGTARLEEAAAAWEERLTVAPSIWPIAWVEQVRTHIDQAHAEITRRREIGSGGNKEIMGLVKVI
jgi:tetratricopeptide (TPR) repeat protein